MTFIVTLRESFIISRGGKEVSLIWNDATSIRSPTFKILIMASRNFVQARRLLTHLLDQASLKKSHCWTLLLELLYHFENIYAIPSLEPF